jgi:hypothetical protein
VACFNNLVISIITLFSSNLTVILLQLVHSFHYALKILYRWHLGGTSGPYCHPCNTVRLLSLVLQAVLSINWRRYFLCSWNREACGQRYVVRLKSRVQKYQRAAYMGNLHSIYSPKKIFYKIPKSIFITYNLIYDVFHRADYPQLGNCY